MANFSSDVEMQKIALLAEDFYKRILFDEEPLFVSDEATLFDVWSGDMEEILKRCSAHYRTSVTLEHAKLPLWKLLPLLDDRRKASKAT
jgi:hypothetical protein